MDRRKGRATGTNAGADDGRPRRPRWVSPAEGVAGSALTRRRIVDTALHLVERDGLASLSMRRVATDLGVSPMSLYNHVADRAEMIDLMVDHILADLPPPTRDEADGAADWPERLRDLGRAWRAAWAGHPGFARVYSDGVTLGPNGLANVEHTLGLLRRAGFSDRDAAAAFFLLYWYAVSSLLIAPVRPIDLDELDRRSDGTGPDRLGRYFSALDDDQIPNVVAVAAHLVGDDFDFGLEVLVAGLASHLERTAAGGAGRGGAGPGVAPPER